MIMKLREIKGKYIRKPWLSDKGISPVVATVLLIAIVIVLVLIVFIWARGFIKEVVMKNEETAEKSCNKINLQISLVGDNLQINNIGNIPLYRVDIRVTTGGDSSIKRSEKNIPAGGGDSITDISGLSSADKIEVIPVILGEVDDTRTAYVCNRVFEVE